MISSHTIAVFLADSSLCETLVNELSRFSELSVIAGTYTHEDILRAADIEVDFTPAFRNPNAHSRGSTFI